MQREERHEQLQQWTILHINYNSCRYNNTRLVQDSPSQRFVTTPSIHFLDILLDDQI